MIEKFQIPIPPLPVQQEIVNILDKFTQLTAELQAELQARKSQYEYYRNQLLAYPKEESDQLSLRSSRSDSSFKENDNSSQPQSATNSHTPNSDWQQRNKKVVWEKLGEIADVNRGIRVVKKVLIENGKYPVFQNCLAPMGYYNSFNCANSTYVISAGAAGEIGFCNENFWAADDCLVFTNLKNINNKYIYYYLMFKQQYIRSNVRKASIPRLSRTVIENLLIPIPPLSEQERIVAILDKFDTLTNSITEGLPKEIELRQKQYEYYRDKLLSFPKKA